MTTNYSGSNYQRILKYIDLILSKPKKDTKFFYFDDGKKFIVNGNMLKLLPFDYHKLYAKDEFYVHVNPTDKIVMFYAYNIEEYLNGRHIDEEEGFMEWKDVEDCIYNFFVLNIKDLTNSVTPYLDAQESRPGTTTTHFPTYSPANGYNGGLGSQGTQGSYGTTHGYGSAAYKEREAFFDKLWALLKENKTSHAMDLIGTHIKKMCDDKKFDELDTLLRLISFEKLNIPTMIGILDATSGADNTLKARKDFFDKVRAHFTKSNIKPARSERILRNLIPGKIKNANTQDTGTV